MGKLYRPKTGDVFSIKIDSTKYSFGQVIYADIEGLVIIYDIIVDKFPLISEIIRAPVIFMAYTTFVFVETGRWEIIGKDEIPTGILYPDYKAEAYVNGTLKTMVYGYNHILLREADESDKNRLRTHKSITPIIIENAIKAKYGLVPWEDYYEDLLYRH